MKEWHALNFAHRGLTLNAPENSMAAFQAALDLGADGIEFDVRLTEEKIQILEKE